MRRYIFRHNYLQATLYYFVYTDILITNFFDNFPKISDHFLKILQQLSEGLTNVSKHFLKIPDDNWRLPKTFKEDWNVFWSYTGKFKYSLRDKHDISEVTDIFTREEMENMQQVWMWLCTNFSSGVFSSNLKH